MDKARSYMKGLISIEKTAIGTDSYLGEFGMNLSKHCPRRRDPERSRSTSPTAAARCTARRSARSTRRSCSTSRRRGIEPDEARKFIVLGFLEPVVVRVPLEDAQDRLREALEAKWDAGFGAGLAGDGTAAA